MKNGILKKIAPILLASAFLVTAQAPASYAISGLDTRGSAALISANNTYYFTLNSSNDEDWFYWENASQRTYSVSSYVKSPSGQNYDLQAIRVVAPSGTEYAMNASDSGTGGYDGISGFKVYPGDKVFFRIKSHNGEYSTSQSYEFSITTSLD